MKIPYSADKFVIRYQTLINNRDRAGLKTPPFMLPTASIKVPSGGGDRQVRVSASYKGSKSWHLHLSMGPTVARNARVSRTAVRPPSARLRLLLKQIWGCENENH